MAERKKARDGKPGRPARKAAKKKPAAKRAASSGRSVRDRAATATGAEGEQEEVPSGARLSAAQQALRDTLILTRKHQGWPWESIAAEAGLSVSGAKQAAARRAEDAPLVLNMDPARIIEELALGYQLSIGDFEALALAAADAGPGQVAAAVGAKRSANDARDKLLTLLQATGRLPQELGALRHLIDLRAIAVRMLDALDQFEVRMARVQLDGRTKRAVADGVLELRGVFNELIGLDEEKPKELAA